MFNCPICKQSLTKSKNHHPLLYKLLFCINTNHADVRFDIHLNDSNKIEFGSYMFENKGYIDFDYEDNIRVYSFNSLICEIPLPEDFDSFNYEYFKNLIETALIFS